MQVGDLIRCTGRPFNWEEIDDFFIVSNVFEDTGVGYADLVHAATLQTGACLRIDDNPYYEIVSARDHSSKKNKKSS